MNEDKIIQKLIEHDDRLDRIEEKLKKLDTIDQVVQTQDEILGILRRMDTEQSATKSAIHRHEERIEHLETDVGTLKTQAQMA